MRAQFCVYACALPLAGTRGYTGGFADKVKLTGQTNDMGWLGFELK